MAAVGAVALTAGFVVVGVTGTVSATPTNPPGNNGTLKIHEEGTPAGTESNDPKVCRFNVEGVGFDPGQQLIIDFEVQGGDEPTGTNAGPKGPYTPDDSGTFATEYFDLNDGHYKATAYGKNANGEYTVDKAKSKVFKVECEAVPRGSLRWLKKDGDGEPLGGAAFKACLGTTCITVRDNQSPDMDPTFGEIQLAELALGTWVITEEEAPTGYVKDVGEESVELDEDGPSWVPVFINTLEQPPPPTATLRWLKRDGSGALLGGATFEVCLAGGDCLTVVDNGALDGDETLGELQLTKLSMGTWTIVEKTAPAGYILDASTETVPLTHSDPSNTDGTPAVPVFVNLSDSPPPPPAEETGTLRWLKVDGAGALLGGATFDVCALGGNCLRVVDNAALDADKDAGEFEVRNLRLGPWTVTEFEAPDGYVRDAGGETVTVTAGTPANAIPEFVNELEQEDVVYGDLGWLKVDDDEELLGGATFEVCHAVDINGNDLAGDCMKVTDNKWPDTDADTGKLAMLDLPLGAWTIKETKAPKGYELDDAAVTVILTEADPSSIGDADAPAFVNVLSEVEGEEAEEAEPTRPAKPAPGAPAAEPDAVLGTEAAVPTEVDAGMVGTTNTTGSNPWGQGLMAAGLMLLILAGAMQVGRRERGVHEA